MPKHYLSSGYYTHLFFINYYGYVYVFRWKTVVNDGNVIKFSGRRRRSSAWVRQRRVSACRLPDWSAAGIVSASPGCARLRRLRPWGAIGTQTGRQTQIADESLTRPLPLGTVGAKRPYLAERRSRVSPLPPPLGGRPGASAVEILLRLSLFQKRLVSHSLARGASCAPRWCWGSHR